MVEFRLQGAEMTGAWNHAFRICEISEVSSEYSMWMTGGNRFEIRLGTEMPARFAQTHQKVFPSMIQSQDSGPRNLGGFGRYL
jgi:hypothetical protein